MGVRQRRMQANYLNVSTTGPASYALMGAGFTELNESPSAKTTSKRYVNDKASSQSVTGYEWSTAYTTDQIREEAAVNFICNIGEKQLIGSEAESDYVIVDLDKPVEGQTNAFSARQLKVAIEVADFKESDGEMTASGNLLGIGDIVLGTFDTTAKTFTAA